MDLNAPSRLNCNKLTGTERLNGDVKVAPPGFSVFHKKKDRKDVAAKPLWAPESRVCSTLLSFFPETSNPSLSGRVWTSPSLIFLAGCKSPALIPPAIK